MKPTGGCGSHNVSNNSYPYKLAAGQFDHLSKEVLVEVLNERSIEAQEVNVVVEEEGPTWMTPIRDYLEKGKLPEDPVDARTLMEKIGNYTIEDGVLYRKSYLVPLMRDARELIRVCDDCQAHAAVPRLPKADMISVTSAWPFMKWGMDIVGPLPEGPGRVKYLIVAIDYFTKWMEAKPLATITGKQVVNFAYNNIVCMFGIPATIVTDNETQFVNDPFKKWAEKLMIKLIYWRREDQRAEEVPNVLWAHRAMKKTSNGETPFSLTNGTEVAIPAEIGMPTHRTSSVTEKTNDQELRLNLNLLEERREIAAIREARYKQQRKGGEQTLLPFAHNEHSPVNSYIGWRKQHENINLNVASKYIRAQTAPIGKGNASILV
ncbi:reverse transcriptase domain-containing protein [Tanacetum coccineum]